MKSKLILKFVVVFLAGWLIKDIWRGSMHPVTPVVILALLICIALTIANKSIIGKK